MARRRALRTVRAREMGRVLARWARSGLTLRAFAAREGMAAGTLSWWRHVLGPSTAPARSGRRPRTPPPRAQFVEVRTVSDATGTAPGVVEVMLPSGHVLRVPAGVARDTLREVVAALSDGC